MPLKLPEDKSEQTKEGPKKLKPRAPQGPPQVQNDALSPEDTIEYGVTEEVSTRAGRKAWIRFAAHSAVRDGESTDEARRRVANFVNEEIDRRIDELGT